MISSSCVSFQIFGGLVWILVACTLVVPANPQGWVMFVSVFCFVITFIWMVVFACGGHHNKGSWAAAVSPPHVTVVLAKSCSFISAYHHPDPQSVCDLHQCSVRVWLRGRRVESKAKFIWLFDLWRTAVRNCSELVLMWLHPSLKCLTQNFAELSYRTFLLHVFSFLLSLCSRKAQSDAAFSFC